MGTSGKDGGNVSQVETYRNGAVFTMQRNFKIFARAVFALNRIGDELYLEPSREGLALRSLNCSKSAYAAFLFSTTFFASYDVDQIRDSENNLCRISMKPALMAFKCAKTLEKSVLACSLFINPKADTMLVQLTHTYDIVKSHEIPLLECTTAFRNIVDKADLKYNLTASSSLLLSLLSEIRQDTSDVTFKAGKEVFAVKNYINRDHELEKLVKTEVKVPTTEFGRFNVSQEVEITVNLKEIKAFVVYADYLQSPLNLYFEEAGSPLVIALENDVHFTGELVVATVDKNYTIFEPSYLRPQPVEQREPLKENVQVFCPSTSEVGKHLSTAASVQPFDQRGPLDEDDVQVLCSSASGGSKRPSTDPGTSSSSTFAKKRLEEPSMQENQATNPAVVETGIDHEKTPTSKTFATQNSSDSKFRQYFLSSSQRTLDASQIFMDKTVLAPDSDEEG
ncbi:unnamed protein product [Enterobius vermicularis]|uniref:Cell cycle checkpoint control protein RAD9A n=1 Tax=Enterobius vermicularis TaxID=51028 RepID=A0A0N4UY27_ENTVE|nr:unnamed protein product [Enterobius vermicularis]